PDGWVPEQKITVEEAVRAYTLGSARAEFTDTIKGSLTPGKLADLVILSDDIFSIPPTAIEKARVLLTLMGGRIVFDAEKSALCANRHAECSPASLSGVTLWNLATTRNLPPPALSNH